MHLVTRLNMAYSKIEYDCQSYAERKCYKKMLYDIPFSRTSLTRSVFGDSHLLRVNREFELTVFSRFLLRKVTNNDLYVYQADMYKNVYLNGDIHIDAKDII